MGRLPSIRQVLAGIWCLAMLSPAPSIVHGSYLPSAPNADQITTTKPSKHHKRLDAVLVELLDAVEVLQTEYFEHWLGTWPKSIDWTGAVMGTHLSAALRTLSEALARTGNHGGGETDLNWKLRANLVDNYFTQVVSYYFGENAVSIRGQAYDDILWVVLGWLEAIRFVDTHTRLHFSSASSFSSSSLSIGLLSKGSSSSRLDEILANQTFHGNVWVPAFSHRARVFWELSTHGWDEEYCGGGMVWNPRLLPYKNAITNELYAAASASMYLYFPGDNNDSPFLNGGAGRSGSGRTDAHRRHHDRSDDNHDDDTTPIWGPRDPDHLQAAVDAYRWLARSDFTDELGLIVDGFHISGYEDPDNNNTECDERNTQVFTYNQGVILTGAKGLWAATGARGYLDDGHRLVRNVIRATGWDLEADRPVDAGSVGGAGAERGGGGGRRRRLPQWHGLGRLGVMEELCDASATCNQDALTFKGIFFHHFTAFCEPLPSSPSFMASARKGEEEDPKFRKNNYARSRGDAAAQEEELVKAQTMHSKACLSYKAWLENNVRAALRTRDDKGKFGMWWTAGLLAPRGDRRRDHAGDFEDLFPLPPLASGGEGEDEEWTGLDVNGHWPTRDTDGIPRKKGAVDYRNDGVPWDSTWRSPEDLAAHRRNDNNDKKSEQQQSEHEDRLTRGELRRRGNGGKDSDKEDPNDRGAGRTVETQGGGLAVIRAYWSLLAQQRWR